MVFFGECCFVEVVDEGGYVAFVVVDVFEDFGYAAPSLGYDVDFVDFDDSAACGDVVGEGVGVLEFFLRLFFHPVCHAVEAFVFEVVCHGHVEVGGPHFGCNLYVDFFLKFVANHSCNGFI